MIKNEILSLKEELLKEIHDVENKLNFQIMVKYEQMTEKNNKFIEDLNIMLEKNKSLIDSATSQNINFYKINDFDNFRKKTDSMLITHEIRINNSIKDIQDIQFKIGKETSDSLTIPGFIGPSCKYKTISNYISSNINEIDRLKNENEINRKENKEIKKKIEEMIKTVLNLVDGSNTKCIDYADKKYKKIEDNLKKITEDFSDKIVNFKSLLIYQDKIKEIHENLNKKIQNNYCKSEIDDIILNMTNDFKNNLDNLKISFGDEINNIIKINMDKLDIEIKENSKSIQEIKVKLEKMNQLQSQLLLKSNLLKKNLLINNTNNNNSNINFNEEENFPIFKKIGSPEKVRKIENIKNMKNYSYKNSEPTFLKEKENKFKFDNIPIKKNEKNKASLNISISSIDKKKQYKFEEKKNSINDFKDKLDEIGNNLSKNKIKEKDLKNSPINSKAINSSLNMKNKTIENKFNYQKDNKNMSKEKNKSNEDNNSFANTISFGNNNQKNIVTSIESETNNRDNNRIINIINDNFLMKEKLNNRIIMKKRGYSLHKLASIELNEKENNFLYNKDTYSNKNINYNIKKPKTPVVKNIFQQTYQINLNNNKAKCSLSTDTPVKISSSFGRTIYTFYDKKEEGINNLINKGIKNKLKKYKSNTTDINLGLSPVSKIKVYGNL